MWEGGREGGREWREGGGRVPGKEEGELHATSWLDKPLVQAMRGGQYIHTV